MKIIKMTDKWFLINEKGILEFKGTHAELISVLLSFGG